MATTYGELIQRAIDAAIAGTDADKNPVLKQRLEAQTLTDLAMQAVAAMVAGNPELRARFQKQFTVTVTNGVATLPAGILLEYLREGSIRDNDTSLFPSGNVYARIKNTADFLTDTQSLLARYCAVDNNLFLCQPGMTDYTQYTSGTLTVDAPYVPDKTQLDTLVDDEVVNDIVEDVAARLRGLLRPEAEAVS